MHTLLFHMPTLLADAVRPSPTVCLEGCLVIYLAVGLIMSLQVLAFGFLRKRGLGRLETRSCGESARVALLSSSRDDKKSLVSSSNLFD